ncbi:electron transport complex protein RnfB [Herbaspirillum sp. SJZ130]|nr:electron transport complex protein RnfB [Herbaspirillum sp. SJZ130]TQK12037.1 electron transport complex protein RnfB [Herbaspirillum sp. SJZ106]
MWPLRCLPNCLAVPPSATTPPALPDLADRIEDLLPQTQCTKCGYPACRPYAEAIADGRAAYNQCPPGGAEGIARLAQLLGQPLLPLNPANGREQPRLLAVIDEQACIGCTLCIQACPVDAIVGAAKQMHTVVDDLCTGCELCVAPCPVDCIAMEEATPGRTGWQAWTQAQANAARARHDWRGIRLERDKAENDARLAAKAAAKLKEVAAAETGTPEQQAEQARKKAIIQAALERARLKKLQAEQEQAGKS